MPCGQPRTRSVQEPHDGPMTITDAKPRPRAFWADARFLLGIVLIVGSIASVWAVVAAARHTVPVLAAARTIVAGEVIAEADLQTADVALGRQEKAYLSPGGLEPGAVALRTIGEGELVARSSIGPAAMVDTTTIVLRAADEVPAAVVTGAVVEVWAAAPRERGEFAEPRVLVGGAVVASVATTDSVMGSSGTSLELVVPRTDVAAALAAIADGSRLSVVPAVAAR